LALIGGGIFAKTSHVPALNKLVLEGRVCVRAVYSRSSESAEATKKLLVPHDQVQIYHGEDLDKLLARSDIHGVILAVPIDTLPEFVLKALKSGKHVLSEKPVSPTIKRGQELVDVYTNHHKDLVWAVAENYYYEPSFIKAADLIAQRAIGTPRVLNATLLTHMAPDNQYYQTQWRQSSQFQGFVFDAGVHVIAAMRLILGDVDKVMGFATQFRKDLCPADTISSTFSFLRGGTLGVLTMSFACSKIASPYGPLSPHLFTIVGDAGILHVGRDKLEIVTQDETGATHVVHPSLQREALTAIVAEIQNFVDAIQLRNSSKNSSGGSGGAIPRLYSPEEALKDVIFLETVLKQHQQITQ